MTNRAVFLLSLAAFASAASLRATDALLPQLAAESLQVNATQIAPAARGSAVSLFALALFTGQSTGVWLAGKVVDAYGTEPVFVAASLGLALLGWGLRRRLKTHARSARV
jgi:predicted MFS family arabinose efflux permease